MQAGRDYLFYQPKEQTEQQQKKTNYLCRPAIHNKQCQRCQSQHLILAPCEKCSNWCHYCLECLTLGKISQCLSILTIPNPILLKRKVNYMWNGTLSQQQKEGSHSILNAIKTKQALLISAVTGAGKTEMMFESIVYALENGLRIGLCAPRIDVILELAPRFQAILPDEDIMILHGQQKQSYRFTQFVIATTHQLLKFTQAFDVLIIDEVDSFPFDNNPMLQQRVPIALSENSVVIYLTATPTPHHEKLVKQGKINVFELPSRYHGHALIVPTCEFVGDWMTDIKSRRKKAKWFQTLLKIIASNRRFLLFFPNIFIMQQFENWLKDIGMDNFETVFAQDSSRVENVLKMRNEAVQFLLTTTILERGVTFRDIDVIVLGADYHFSKAALVQIAGRVGRHKDFPTGKVYFWHNGQTKAIKQAVAWIKRMNTLAKKKGLIQ